MYHMEYFKTLLLTVLVLLAILSTHPVLAKVEDSVDMINAPTSPKGIQGLWVWRFDTIANPDNRKELLDFCEQFHFNRLLVQIHTIKGEAQLRDAAALTALVTDAADRSITVEALEGGPYMAEKANLASTLARLKMILDFNQSLPTGKKLVGIHYDIEPYTTPQWKQDMATRTTVMTNLMDFAHLARKELDSQTPPMTLAFDIPFWYDNKTADGDNCFLNYNGKTQNLYQHLLDVSDYIGIMSYRRKAEGSNGVLQHIQNELDYARSIGKQITPALETIELKSSPTITFFGLPASEFWTQHNTIRQSLQNDPAFGGVLTHSYRGMRELLQPQSSDK